MWSGFPASPPARPWPSTTCSSAVATDPCAADHVVDAFDLDGFDEPESEPAPDDPEPLLGDLSDFSVFSDLPDVVPFEPDPPESAALGPSEDEPDEGPPSEVPPLPFDGRRLSVL